MIGNLELQMGNFRALMGRAVMAIVATTMLIAAMAGEAISQQPSKALEESFRKNAETYKIIFNALDRKDFPAAEKLLMPLARRGEIAAEILLSALYMDGGQNYPKKEKEALSLLNKAVARGDIDAMHALADLYSQGSAVPKNNETARGLYEKAALGGNLASMKRLAMAYSAGGELAALNDSESFRWWMMAARNGDSSAQWNVAFMYEHGQGIPQSIMDSYVWYSIAAANSSHDLYRKSRDNIARELSSSQLIVAQNRAKRCMTSGYKNCDD